MSELRGTRGSVVRVGWTALLLTAAALSGCAHHRAPLASPMMPGEDPRCALAVDQPAAIISEWSPAEKANLEQALRRGAVAVEHLGCGLRVLSQCAIGGGYTWQRTGPAQASVELNDEAALFERLPLSAVPLQAELRREGRLRLATHLAGEFLLQQGAQAQVPFEGECAYATHVITALTVGASALTTGDGRVLRGAGDPAACAQAGEGGPHPSCAAPLQVSLARIPGRGPEEPPPGMAQVDVVSAFEEQTWDLYAGEDYLCTTPCTQWVDPLRPLRLNARGKPRDRIRLPGLGVEALEARNAVLLATGSCEGKFVNGLVFTTFGGMGTVVAITLTAVGCSDVERRGGMCNAGLITGAVSVPLTAFAIWLLVDSAPRADVLPVYRVPQGRGQPPLTFGVGPTGINGTF